jgi:hypothetical protein
MKSKILLIALYSVAFMFPAIGTVDTAGADPVAHSSMGAPAPFDDGLMGAPGMSGAAITGNDTIACGEYNKDWRGEIRCLRTLLDTTPMAAAKGSDGLGAYGCHNKNDRQQQIHCLRNILDGNGLAPGTN